MQHIIDALLFVSGMVTGWFFEPGTARYGVVQFGLAVLIVTGIVLFFTFWPFWLVKKIYRSYRKH